MGHRPASEQVHAQRRHGTELSEWPNHEPGTDIGRWSGRRGTYAETAEYVRHGNGEHQGTREGVDVEEVCSTSGVGERERKVQQRKF